MLRRSVLLFLSMLILTGCSTLQVNRGYSFKGGRVGKANLYTSCGEVSHYLSEPFYDRVDITDQESFQESFSNGDIWINIKILESYSDHWITAGPGILIPLPIVPWPYGIVSELISADSPKKTFGIDIYMETNSSGYKFNPESVFINQEGNIIKPIIEKGSAMTMSPNKFASFRLRFDLPLSSKEPIKLAFNGVSKNGQNIAFKDPSIIFKKSFLFYWAGINC